LIKRTLCLLQTASFLLFNICLLSSVRVIAQQVDSSLYSGMKWRMIGPFRAGKVNAVAGVPGDPGVYYFGSNGGGVWKTTDGGNVWKPIFDSQPIASIGALTLAPSNPKIIYVGSGENNLYADITYGNGVYKSSDGGSTWQHLGLEDTRHIARILVDPRNPDIVLLAAMGHSYGPNSERGVFRSTDGGRNWKKVLYKDDLTGAVDLRAASDDPRIVYAALWHPIRKPGQSGTTFGAGSGIYKSSDEGVTWTQLTGHGLPPGDWGRIGVAVAPGTHGKRVFALIEANGKSNGLFRSDDGGANWQRATTDDRIIGYWYMSEIFIDPQNADVIYIPKQSLYRSTDGGKTFTVIKGAPGGDDYQTMWIDPTNSRRMMLGVDQGATISVNGGETWSTWYNQPTGQFYRVATDHDFPYWVYGPQQDSGTVGTSSRGNDGQITQRDWFPVGPGESGYTIPDPLNSDVVFNAGPFGSVVRLSKRTGQVRDVSPAPIAFGAPYRFHWNIPMVFSPQDPHVLYLGTQFVLKTVNGGSSWEAISPDLTRSLPDAKDPKKPLGSLMTIAPSPVKEGVIWAGSDDGAIQLTRDGGASWQNVTPAPVSEWSAIQLIEASHFDAGTAYVAVNRNPLDDVHPHILQTHDFGQTWQETVTGIRDGDFVRTVREDPVRKSLLYAGSEQGAYVSFDGGGHWQSLRLNMPVVAVDDLAVEQGDLVAATYGRSFWILDDVSVLRQIDPQATPTEAVLFTPRKAIRVRRDENQDTPLPPEIPAGKNPPDGAILNYFLPPGTTSDIKLEIYDQNEKLVRAYSSAPLPETHEQPLQIVEYWIEHPAPMPKGPGMHRVVWNLRYPDPQAVHVQTPYNYPMGAIVGETPLPPLGPVVLPGKYEVRLTVDAHTFRQPLEVKMDPRVNYAQNQLESSLALELKISAALGRNFAGFEQVKDLRSRLEEFTRRPVGDPIATAATALDAKAAAIQGESISPFDTPNDSNFTIVNDSLIALIALVDGADFAPSEASFAAMQRMCVAMNGTLGKWQGLKANEVANFRKVIESEKGAAIPDYPAIAIDPNCGPAK
jgi:photosystem II stability/assembly factor-like uncharacterized protein